MPSKILWISPHVPWIDAIIARYNIDRFLVRFNLTTELVVEMISCFGMGWAVGFLVRRYFKMMVILFAFCFVFIKGLEYIDLGYLFFDFDRLKALTGVSLNDTVGSVINHYVAWTGLYVRQLISFVVGFFISMRRG